MKNVSSSYQRPNNKDEKIIQYKSGDIENNYQQAINQNKISIPYSSATPLTASSGLITSNNINNF